VDDTRDDTGCPKCGATTTDSFSMSTSDSMISTVIDLPDEAFTIVSCEFCGYSELYRDGAANDDAPGPETLFLGG
jgi:uncharacterized protein